VKKTTAYARRLKHQGHYYNGARWLTTIAECCPYDSDKPVGASAQAMSPKELSDQHRVDARLAFEQIKGGAVHPASVRPIDLLSHCIGVACIRAAQIAGDDAATNPLLAQLVPANQALQRCIDRRRALGVWGFDGLAISQVADGLDAWETILLASSPQQMHAAALARLEALGGRVQEGFDGCFLEVMQ
jgi:hypothetical protein